jgi:hypothetical protein
MRSTQAGGIPVARRLPLSPAEVTDMDAMMDGTMLAEGAAFTEGLAQIFIVAQFASLLFVLGLLCASHHTYLCGTVRRLCCFRCPLMRREVEVEFLESWLFGVRCSATPTRCSAFEVPTTIECRRPCMDRSYRHQWEFALPVAGRLEAKT